MLHQINTYFYTEAGLKEMTTNLCHVDDPHVCGAGEVARRKGEQPMNPGKPAFTLFVIPQKIFNQRRV